MWILYHELRLEVNITDEIATLKEDCEFLSLEMKKTVTCTRCMMFRHVTKSGSWNLKRFVISLFTHFVMCAKGKSIESSN